MTTHAERTFKVLKQFPSAVTLGELTDRMNADYGRKTGPSAPYTQNEIRGYLTGTSKDGKVIQIGDKYAPAAKD